MTGGPVFDHGELVVGRHDDNFINTVRLLKRAQGMC